VGAVELAVLGEGAPAREEHGHLVALGQRGDDLVGGLQGGLEARLPLVHHAHARRVVEEDGHRRIGPAEERAEAGESRVRQAQRDQQQRRRPHRHQEHVVDPLAAPRLLHADPQEPQRAEGELLGPLPVDHVQDHRDRCGQAGQKEKRGQEGHGCLQYLQESPHRIQQRPTRRGSQCVCAAGWAD